jgi:hypothetical protein
MEITLTESRLKEARGNAQRRFDEIVRLIVDGPNSLCELLVKASRAGLPAYSVDDVAAALQAAVVDMRLSYTAAMAVPEVIVRSKRVVL